MPKIKNRTYGNIILLFTLIASLTSCNFNSVFEQSIDFNNNRWLNDSLITFEFNIKESGDYNLLYSIKNKNNYPFSNLYVKSDLRNGDQQITNDLQELILFDKKTGKPFGRGFGGVHEHKFYAIKNQSLQEGKHTLVIQHYMRQDELSGIMSFGVHVEKATK